VRVDGSEGQFAFERVDHLTLAARAERGVVDAGGHDGLGNEHDVFLDVGALAADERVGCALAVAFWGSVKDF